MASKTKSTNLENVGRITPTYSFLPPRSLMVQSTVSYTKQEETLEYTSRSKTKDVDLEKEMSVVSDILEKSFPRRRGRKPPTMEEETPIDSNQAAKAYGGVVIVSYPKVANNRSSGSKLYYRTTAQA